MCAPWLREVIFCRVGVLRGHNLTCTTMLDSNVARVLMRVLADNQGAYDPDMFLEQYKAFMTDPGSHNDTFAEAIHRQFFANHLLRGTPLSDSAGAENHDTPSIGAFPMLPPMLLLGVRKDSLSDTLVTAQRHLQLTHVSERLGANAAVYAHAFWSVLNGGSLREAALEG